MDNFINLSYVNGSGYRGRGRGVGYGNVSFISGDGIGRAKNSSYGNGTGRGFDKNEDTNMWGEYADKLNFRHFIHHHPLENMIFELNMFKVHS